MLFKTLNGRIRKVEWAPYLIDWDAKREVSRPQARVKAFLRPYWQHDTVLEEAEIVGRRMRLDLFNISKGIVVEVSPEQHGKYNPFFHGSIAGFKAAMKRDLAKERWCELNRLTYCELTAEDLAGELTADLFLQRFNVVL